MDRLVGWKVAIAKSSFFVSVVRLYGHKQRERLEKESLGFLICTMIDSQAF
jgi:hypothetical protein